MTVMKKDKDKVMKAFNSLKEQIDLANSGKISFSEVFHKININDFLPDGEIIPTIWSIEHLRDRFPFYTTDQQLTACLESMSGLLNMVSVDAGWEFINSIIKDVYREQNVPILHIDYLTPKDKQFIEQHIYPAFKANGYPMVEIYGNRCHVIHKIDWDNMREQIAEWNLKYKLHLTACFYICKSSELKQAY